MSYGSGGYFGWEPRKSAADRRADAARKIKDAAHRGKPMAPVTIAGRKIAQTFWGKAWCDNLERYRDFAHRLERGRSYVRNGSVIHLELDTGKIGALVSGSAIYKVVIEIDAVERAAWRAIQKDCAGSIGSRVDLLSGRLTEPVMARLCTDRTGLFPPPSAIRFKCSCPDYAIMCKHVAAVMYGVGARLDHAPELLFTLRRVTADELIAAALSELPAAAPSGRVLAADGLAALFGIELAEPVRSAAARKPRGPAATRAATVAPAKLAKPARRARATSSKPRARGAKPATRSSPTPRGAGPKRKRPAAIGARRLDAMAEEATVDAYGESEQISGWFCMFEQHLDVPFATTVLGATVTVEAIDLDDDDRIVAVCKRGRSRQTIEIRELPLPSPAPAGAEWIEAYSRWRKGW